MALEMHRSRCLEASLVDDGMKLSGGIHNVLSLITYYMLHSDTGSVCPVGPDVPDVWH